MKKYISVFLLSFTVLIVYAAQNKLLTEAKKLYQQKEYTSAAVLYERYINEDDEDNAYVWFNIGVCYYMADEGQKSANAFLKAHKINKNDNEILYRLAMAYKLIDKTNRVLHFLQKAYLNEKKTKEKEKYKKHLFKEYKNLAYSYYNVFDLTNAEWAFLKAINFNNNFADGFNALGRIYLYWDKNKEAKKALSAAIKLENTSVRTFLNLALLYARENESEKCFYYTKEALDRNMLYAQYAYLYRSILYFNQGNKKKGFELLGKAFEYDRETPLLSYKKDFYLESGLQIAWQDENFKRKVTNYFKSRLGD